MKVKANSKECLYDISETCSFSFMVLEVLNIAFHAKQKSPKMQEEALNWIEAGLADFGMVDKSKMKDFVLILLKVGEAKNPAVRKAFLKLISSIWVYKKNFIEHFRECNVQAKLFSLIETECNKRDGETPKTPTRGIIEEEEDEEEENKNDSNKKDEESD